MTGALKLHFVIIKAGIFVSLAAHCYTVCGLIKMVIMKGFKISLSIRAVPDQRIYSNESNENMCSHCVF